MQSTKRILYKTKESLTYICKVTIPFTSKTLLAEALCPFYEWFRKIRSLD